MEFLSVLLTLAGMHLVMAMLPGPNTVIVGWFSATLGRRAGFKAVAGVVTASLIWVVLSLWGFGALLVEAGWLYRLMRFAGAAYLVYVGLRMLLAACRRTPALAGSAASGPAVAGPAGRRPFRAGLMTTLSNPKSAVFWTSAFLLVVPLHAPGWLYAVIVLVIAVQASCWYGLVALLLSSGPARRHYLRLVRWLDILAGSVMVALGLRLAEEVRRELA